MDWKQELFKRLDALAEKLGTTATYLWAVLVKQAKLEAIANIAVGCLLLLLVIVCSVISYKSWMWLKQRKWPESGVWFPAIFPIVVGLIMFAVACSQFYDGFLGYMNPEFYALQRVLQAIQ